MLYRRTVQQLTNQKAAMTFWSLYWKFFSKYWPIRSRGSYVRSNTVFGVSDRPVEKAEATWPNFRSRGNWGGQSVSAIPIVGINDVLGGLSGEIFARVEIG